ncbi:hypothetical protein ACIRJO_14625 [Streptomyces sp. NPDC102394]|uniref:hypothetical protein n=1 Tax=Streptomyces sp. NPDC102394 TaxID=3366167 RepID=UPI0037F812FB
MTHDPHEESAAGGGPSERYGETAPQWEVMTGPGGAEATSEPAWDRVWRRRSGRARAVIAATTVAVLALGGTAAYAATSGGPASGATPSASGSAAPSPDGPRGGHGGHWFDFGGMGVHGESTVKDQDTGTWVVRVWQRGSVEKAGGDQVTVKSEDGAVWTWTVDSGTTVLHDGTRGSGTGALKKGDTVFLVGTRSDSGTRTALRVLSGSFDGKGPGGNRSDPHWRGGFPGPGRHGWGMPGPSASPSGNGATT